MDDTSPWSLCMRGVTPPIPAQRSTGDFTPGDASLLPYTVLSVSCSVRAHTHTHENQHGCQRAFADLWWPNQEWELWSAVTSHLKGKLTDYLLTICLVAVSRGWQGETYCHQNFSLVLCNVPYQSASLQSRVKRTETQLHALCVQYMEGGNTLMLFTVHHFWMCLKSLLSHYESLVFPVSIAL